MTPKKYAIPFWDRVNKNAENGCWEWTAYRDINGYGHITINQKESLAHRKAWELTNGEIPTGMFLCHKCDNPSCVNPDHMFIGTQKENLNDMRNKGRGFDFIPLLGEDNPASKITRKQAE